MINKKYVTPTCIKKWQSIYDNVIFDWEMIYTCAFRIARETALQSFQHKIINRYIPCRYNLYKWKKSDNDLCNYCNGKNVDTIEHFLVECPRSKEFWSKFFAWWKMIYDVNIGVNVLDIVFGIANQDQETVLNSLNFCILFGKFYIYKCKKGETTILFEDFKHELYNRLKCESYLMQMENNNEVFHNNWYNIMESLVQNSV